MAKITHSVIGTLSAKIGQVVGAPRKGIPVLRVLASIVAQPQANKQLT
jgi:hypothetical protein